MNPAGTDDYPCNVLVERVTEYLEGALPPDEIDRLEAHLSLCPGCQSVLEQFRLTIRLAGHLDEAAIEEVDPGVRHRLIVAFREARQGSRDV